MIGVLKFQLPQEKDEFELAQRAAKYYAALEDMDNYLRGRLKYEDLEAPVNKAIQEAREKLAELQSD